MHKFPALHFLGELAQGSKIVLLYSRLFALVFRVKFYCLKSIMIADDSYDIVYSPFFILERNEEMG